MKTIRTIELSGSTRQERLPGFAEDFPYIASWAETGQYNGGMVPWHWHPAVELFYMYSGSLVYETPQGTRTFGPGSGGLVNANVLHSTRNLPGDRVVSWIHLFEPSLLGGSVGSRIEQKYLVPITANPALELLALDPADRLVHSGQQITAIAVDCGFASLSYFGKVFRQKFGCTPAQFRSKWQDITNTGR